MNLFEGSPIGMIRQEIQCSLIEMGFLEWTVTVPLCHLLRKKGHLDGGDPFYRPANLETQEIAMNWMAGTVGRYAFQALKHRLRIAAQGEDFWYGGLQ